MKRHSSSTSFVVLLFVLWWASVAVVLAVLWALMTLASAIHHYGPVVLGAVLIAGLVSLLGFVSGFRTGWGGDDGGGWDTPPILPEPTPSDGLKTPFDQAQEVPALDELFAIWAQNPALKET